MGTSLDIVYDCNGSLTRQTGGGPIDANLLIVESGRPSATIWDDDKILNQSDDDTSRFSRNNGSVTGQSIDNMGSGGMSTVSLLGITLDTRPVAALSVNGQIYLIAPEGFPLLSGLSISCDIDPNASYPLSTFVPFLVEDTLIATPKGYVPIRALEVGDMVLDRAGQSHQILWHGRRHAASFNQDCPLRFPRVFSVPAYPLSKPTSHSSIAFSSSSRNSGLPRTLHGQSFFWMKPWKPRRAQRCHSSQSNRRNIVSPHVILAPSGKQGGNTR